MNIHKMQIRRIVEELAIPPGRFILAGSGVMVMNGMNRVPRDLDIFTTTRQWFGLWAMDPTAWAIWTPEPNDRVTRCDPPYLHRNMHGLEVTVYFHWRQRGVGDIDANFWIHNAQMIEGVPCLPLGMLLAWKDSMGRDKDAQDIELIKEFLRNG